MAKPFQAHMPKGYTKAIITAKVPGPHMWPCPGPRPDSNLSPSASKQ